jgi:citrate lyase subunit beta / citryl-CoA lyase
MALVPRRSALYMPGSNVRALEKARTVAADVVIMDLEDAVAPDAKATARVQVAAAVTAGGFGRREVVVRINAPDSAWGEADLAAVATSGADAILVPKVGTARDLVALGRRLTALGAPDRLKVWAMIETPLAILNVASIAEASAQFPDTRLDCLILGTNDLLKETRAELDANRTAALYWLSATVTAGRAYDLDVLDGVYNDFRDSAGLAREATQGRQLGMAGKTVIHPDQLAAVNAIFQPSAAEVATAEKIIAAFELPENQGRGVITLDGRMVELLHADMARRTVAIARAIADRAAS